MSPEGLILQAVVNTSETEATEGESRQETGLVVFPLLVRLGQIPVMINVPVVRPAPLSLFRRT